MTNIMQLAGSEEGDDQGLKSLAKSLVPFGTTTQGSWDAPDRVKKADRECGPDEGDWVLIEARLIPDNEYGDKGSTPAVSKTHKALKYHQFIAQKAARKYCTSLTVSHSVMKHRDTGELYSAIRAIRIETIQPTNRIGSR